MSRFAIARLALSLSTLFLLLAVIAAESLSATAADAPQPTPPVQRVPEAWLSAFQIKRGFRLEVVASEALVSAPVAMAFDENGRLFVAEMRDLPNKQTQAPHLGRIRLLEDTDGDGIFDASTVYADNLAWPSAIACYDGGLFVASTPDILYLKDVNGDGVADTRRIVFSGFGGTNDTTFDRLINSFAWGLDNRIHGLTAGLEGAITAGGAVPGSGGELIVLHGQDFSFDPRSLSLAADAGPAQSGLAFDIYGRRFVTDYQKPLRVAVWEEHQAERNPFFVRPERLTRALNSALPVFPFNAEVAKPSAARTSATRGPVAAAPRTWMTHARGLAIYRGNAFPVAYGNNAFICDPEAHLIHRAVLRDNGLEMAALRAADELDSEFLSSSDPLFRPMQVINGPDGALYVADIQNGGDSGRILRIAPETLKQNPFPKLGKARTVDLVTALAQGNGWQQDTAERLLFERHDPASVVLLTNMIYNSRLPLARLRALHALDGQGQLNAPALVRCLRDTDEHVREDAVLLSEKMARNGPLPEDLWRQVQTLANDPAIRVRFQLAVSLAEYRRSEGLPILRDLLARNFTNAWFHTAALSCFGDGAATFFAALATEPGWRSDSARLQFLFQLATMIGVRGRMEEVTQVIDFIDRTPMAPQETYLLLHALGEGLVRTGSSLALVDPQLRLGRFYEQTENVIVDETAPETLRIAALRLRSVSPYTTSGSGDFLQLLFGSHQSPPVEAAAVATVGRYENRNIPDNLFARWRELTAPLRTEAIGAFLSRTDRVPAVLGAVQSGRIQPQDFSPIQINLLRMYPDKSVSQAAERVFGAYSPRRPGVFEAVRGALRISGTASRGRPIFNARCGACHGTAPGAHPSSYYLDFSPAQKERVLRAIIEPGSNLPPEAAARVVISKRGDIWIGHVRDSNKQTLTLEQPNGREIVLPLVNIADVYAQPWSIMSEGLETGLTVQQLADLLEYVVTPVSAIAESPLHP